MRSIRNTIGRFDCLAAGPMTDNSDIYDEDPEKFSGDMKRLYRQLLFEQLVIKVTIFGTFAPLTLALLHLVAGKGNSYIYFDIAVFWLLAFAVSLLILEYLFRPKDLEQLHEYVQHVHTLMKSLCIEDFAIIERYARLRSEPRPDRNGLSQKVDLYSLTVDRIEELQKQLPGPDQNVSVLDAIGYYFVRKEQKGVRAALEYFYPGQASLLKNTEGAQTSV